MFSATPHKKAQNLNFSNTPFASPSFTSGGSSFKRKRDQIEKCDQVSTNTRSIISTIRRDDFLACKDDNELILSKIFSSGDILLLNKIDDKPSILNLLHRAHKGGSRITSIAWPLSTPESLGDAFDIGKTFNNSTDMISCTSNGVLILINITAEGSIAATEHKILLGEENERVTSVCHAGNVLLIGTSTEDMYLIRKDKSAVSADRLQRTQSMFLGLLQTGAKLIGILPNKDSNRQIVKILPLHMSPLMLSVGNTLTLWSDWSTPGKERVVWEFKLKQLIRSDVKSFGEDVTKLRLVDAHLMPMETGASSTVLLVLSVSTDAIVEEDLDDNASGTSCSLWLHTFNIVTPPTGLFHTNSNSELPVSIMHRMLLTDSVQFNMLTVVSADGSSSSSSNRENCTTFIKPKLCNNHPSWRVFISWGGTSTTHSTATLQCTHLDVLNQGSIVGDEALNVNVNSIRCPNVFDTGIASTAVLDTSVVEGVDGVVALISDGSLLQISPPLIERAPRDFSRQQKDVKKGTVSIANVKALLTAIANGESNELGALTDLRDVVVALSAQDMLESVREVSHRVLNRAPTGQYWGTSSTLRGLTNQALTRYQMIHRLVEEKLVSHKRLLTALDTTSILSLEDVRVLLLREHQQILLCAGLSGAVQESQLRLTNATSSVVSPSESSPAIKTNALTAGLFPDSRSPQPSDVSAMSDASNVFSVSAHKESLKVVALGMDIAVRRMRKVSIEEIESQGLSIVDQFYSEASQISDGLLAIAMALVESQNESTALFHAAYGVASIMLSALTFSNNGEGAKEYSTSIMCHPKTRQALLLVVDMLHTGIQKLGGATPAGFTLQREGNRLKQFFSLLLTGFVIDATHEVDLGRVSEEAIVNEGEGGEHMSAEWKAEYHAAKTKCITLLLTISHAQAAFVLSDEHLLFSGLMEAVEIEASLQPQLDNVLRVKSHMVGTDNVPMMTACMLWLEENNRSADILRLGSLCKPLLESFLESRPQLSWMNHLKNLRFGEATQAAVTHARHVPNKAKANTLLSIAKLSAILAKEEVVHDKPKTLRFVESPHISNKATTNLDDIVVEMKANLAVIKCQEQLQQLCPSEFKQPDQRSNVTDLVKLITRIVMSQQQNHGLTNGSDKDEIVFTHPLTQEDIVQYFGIGVSLLNMELDMVEAMSRSASSTPSSSGSAKRLAAADVDLIGQTNALRSLLVSLWGAVVATQSETWLMLSTVPSLSQREEDSIREDILLYKAIIAVYGEVVAGHIRETLLPDRDGELLEALVAVSGVAEKRLNAQGDIEQLINADMVRNERVVYVIKVCVEMALSECSSQQNMQH